MLSAGAWAAEPAVGLDARVELVGLVRKLAGDPRAPSNPLADAAAERFARLRSHPAVTGLPLRGDLVFQYAVYLSEPPELAPRWPAPAFFGDKAELESWRRNLAAFARESGFLDWERETRAERERLAAQLAKSRARDLGGPLAALLGARTWNEWKVVVSAFHAPGGGAAWVLEEKPGRPDVYVVYGPYGRSDFASGALPEAVFTAAYALYEACRPAFSPEPDVCAGLEGLGSAEDCVQQHLVRELTARLAGGKEYRAAWPKTRFQAPVRRAVDAYLADRERYPDLLAASSLLLAPFQAGGRAPDCRLVDPQRFAEEVYSRRLAYYLEGRLEARPDAELARTLDELKLVRGRP